MQLTDSICSPETSGSGARNDPCHCQQFSIPRNGHPYWKGSSPRTDTSDHRTPQNRVHDLGDAFRLDEMPAIFATASALLIPLNSTEDFRHDHPG